MANRQTIVVGVASVGVAAAAAALWTYYWYDGGRLRHQATTPLHVSYPHPQLPLVIRLLAKLPKSVRKTLAIKGSAPKLPVDGVDLLGPDYNPFDIRALVNDKLWRVRYKYIRDATTIAASKMIFGLDPSDPAILERAPPEKVSSLKTLMDEMSALEEKNAGLDPKDRARNELQAGYEDSQDMLVARLDNDGGLLLYNPCRMHSRITEWLETLGTPVTYIMSGSSSHTNMLPQAAHAFPLAKIICAKAAELKCENVGMRRADYIYTNHSSSHRGFDALARELDQYNVKTCHIAGDVLTQTLNVIVHNHLLDVDLSCYGNGERLLHFDQDEWDDCCNPAIIFHHSTMMNTTISGYLPNFRLMAMDPTSPFCKLCIDEPDANDCMKMAASLRNMLAMKFSYVDNVHSKRKESLPAKEFAECVDASWNWLDGKSLLL